MIVHDGFHVTTSSVDFLSCMSYSDYCVCISTWFCFLYGLLSPKVNILQIKKNLRLRIFWKQNKTKQSNILEFLFEHFSVINEEREQDLLKVDLMN